MLYHIPDLEPNWRQKICPVAKGLMAIVEICWNQVNHRLEVIFFQQQTEGQALSIREDDSSLVFLQLKTMQLSQSQFSC